MSKQLMQLNQPKVQKRQQPKQHTNQRSDSVSLAVVQNHLGNSAIQRLLVQCGSDSIFVLEDPMAGHINSFRGCGQSLRHIGAGTAQSSDVQRDDTFSAEAGEQFKKVYLHKGGGCMSTVYKGIGSLYGKKYSEDLRKRVVMKAREIAKTTKRVSNYNNISLLMNTIHADGKAGEKHTLHYQRKEKAWKPEPELTIMQKTSSKAGWYFFGLSLSGSYHSVMLAVDKTTPDGPQLYWADQVYGLKNVTGKLTETMQAFKPRYGYTNSCIWQLIPPSNTNVETEETINVPR